MLSTLYVQSLHVDLREPYYNIVMKDNKNMTHEQLRDTLVKLQNDGFRFVIDDRDGDFRYDERDDELTNGLFKQFPLLEMTDIHVVNDVELRFEMYEWNHSVFATKTVLGKF